MNLESLKISQLQSAFAKEQYIAGQEVVIPVYLALKLEKPLLITGAPGVGKTEIAKVLAKILNTDLIRLQCYEGLDEGKALYEWNYQKQLIKIQLVKDSASEELIEKNIFSRDYLLERPLLKAIQVNRKVVLLIDEIDKTDEEFEAFLFELLSDFQVSIPELGTLNAQHIPVVILTSNGEREISDGLKRRCVYLYIDYPSVAKEMEIIETKVPEAGKHLAQEIALAVHYLRYNLELKKKPSISESLDTAKACTILGVKRLNEEVFKQILALLLKDKEDMDVFSAELGPAGLLNAIKEKVLTM